MVFKFSKIVRDKIFDIIYSYRKASIGESLDALYAGKIPNIIPIEIETVIDNIIAIEEIMNGTFII